MIKFLNSDKKKIEFLSILIFTWSCFMMAFAAARSVRHDYSSYLKQWALVLNGKDPWLPLEMTWETNIYGPLHNVFAFLLPLSPIAPKILWALCFVLVNYLIFKRITQIDLKNNMILVYLFSIPFNFLVISIVFSYGNNDSIVAALVGVAILARFKNKLFYAGVLLGLATLIKYYPLLISIFFTLNYKKITLKPMVVAFTTTLTGLAINYVFYGKTFLSALIYGDTRETKFFSILHSLKGKLSTEGLATDLIEFIIAKNTLLVILTCMIIYVISYRENLSWVEASVVGTITFLITFKASSPQYFIPLLFLVSALLISNTARSIRLASSAMPLMLLLSIFQFGYEILTDKYILIGNEVRENIGFLIFSASTYVLIQIFKPKPRSLA